MIAYVKNRSDFKTSHKLQVTEYNYCINSAYENISSFIVVGEYSGLEESFLVCDEHFGVINSCTPKDGLTTIQCQKIVTIFGRQLVLTESEAYIEDFMKRVIETQFKNLADSVFAMPYINVTITSHTAYSRPVNDNGIWQLEKYISRVKRLFDIYTDITVNNNVLQVTIGHRNVPMHNIDFKNSNYDLIQETYSSEAVSKISVVGEGAITDYYLFDDGSYGTNPSAGTRVQGKWEFRDSADNIGYVFASNSDSHLIQFRSYKKFLYGDKLAVRSNGRVIYTYINQILRDSKDDRYLYKTGNVTETASEIISEQGKDIADIQQTLEFNTLKSDRDGSIDGKLEVSGDIYEGGVKLSDKYGGGGGGGGLGSVVVDGSGNAVTTASLANNTLTLTKGTTFATQANLTSHTGNTTVHVTAADKASWNAKSDFSGSYNDLTDAPTIPISLAELQEDTTHRVVTTAQIAEWNAKSDFSGSYNDLTDKPLIPTSLSQLTEDGSHRVVTDAEKASWNAKYLKSSSGIPMGDLSDEVQTLLRSIGTDTAVFTDEIIIGDVRLKRYSTKRLMITDVES